MTNGAYPWEDSEDEADREYSLKADANGDGLVSFREAFEFAVKYDKYAQPGVKNRENPQFAESTPGLGDGFFTLKQASVEMATFVSAAYGEVSLPKAYVESVIGDHATYVPDADWDGDGAANYAEYVAGTNPNLAEDRLAIGGLFVDGDWVSLTFPRHGGRRYSLKTAESPAGPWTSARFGTSMKEDDFALSLTFPSKGGNPAETTIYVRPGSGRYFRIVVERGSAL